MAGGHARVADMGLARWLTPESMGVLTGETGTYLYMSPEMIRHELYNSRTDVYSWGVLLVELVSQRVPYEDQRLTPLQVCCLLMQFHSLCFCTRVSISEWHSLLNKQSCIVKMIIHFLIIPSSLAELLLDKIIAICRWHCQLEMTSCALSCPVTRMRNWCT